MLDHQEFTDSYLDALRELVGSGMTITTTFGGRGASHRPPPYFSNIGGCARAIYYEMVEPKGERGPPQHPWQTTMGLAGQDLIVQTLRFMGYEVFDQEKSTSWGGLSGRIDGKLTGYDLGTDIAVWDCKLRNSFAICDLIRDGLAKADREIYCQMQAGMAAEDTDVAIVTFHPYDVSDTRGRMSQYKISEFDPHVIREVVHRDDELLEDIAERVDMLNIAKENSLLPAREYEPTQTRVKSPCRFCSFKTQCLGDGVSDFVVTPLVLNED